MKLGTTSAVLTFAIDLNGKAKQYYTQFIEAADDSNLISIIHFLQKHQTKHAKRLKRFRRELVTEMILEPIHEFNSEEFELDIELTREMDMEKITEALLRKNRFSPRTK